MTAEDGLDALNAKIRQWIREEGISVRGHRLVGTVVSTKMRKTVTVSVDYVKRDPKYKRWYRARSKIHAHVPGELKLNEGDVVEITSTRKLSKTKAMVVTKVLKKAGGESA